MRTGSLAIYCTLPPVVAFGVVASRAWQFLTGATVAALADGVQLIEQQQSRCPFEKISDSLLENSSDGELAPQNVSFLCPLEP